MAPGETTTERRTRRAPSVLWRVAATVPEHAVAAFEAALGPAALALACFEDGPGRAWRVEALHHSAPDRTAVAAAAAAAAAAAGIAVPDVEVAKVADRDWVAESQSRLPPVRVGRYHIRGRHVQAAPPPAIDLVIEAGRAFGTGLHESTRGCLIALGALARARRFANPLDLGCGSGVLALAMARTWRVPVLAVDVDPAAVLVARGNARLNGVAGLVRCLAADGPRRRAVAARAPFDLVTANILARPLVRLAADIGRCLSLDGRVVLSGLLARDEALVLGAYRAAGLGLVRRIALGDWRTLVVGRRRAPPGPGGIRRR